MVMVWDLEIKRFKEAWHYLTGRRDVVGEKNLKKVAEAISIIHNAIAELSKNEDEAKFCHQNLYTEFLKYVSEDFDRVYEYRKRSPSEHYKFNSLLGWCNKPDRVKNFIISRLALYEINVGDISEIDFNNDIFIENKRFGFILKDQFGCYYIECGNPYNMVVLEDGEDTVISFEKFVCKKRPSSHNVNITYILRRLVISDRLNDHQRRFVRLFATRNLAYRILSGKSTEMVQSNSKKVRAVRRRGPTDGSNSKIKAR